MTWMWDDKERLQKLIKTVQKWMEFQSSNNCIDEDAVEMAFHKAKKNSYGIVEKFDIQDPEMAGFLQSWIELGLFAGYLTGWKDSNKVLAEIPNPTGGKGPISPDDFYLTEAIDKAARKYAHDSTEEQFNKLLAEPVSVLIVGLPETTVSLLRVCHESSLYTGFLGGVEDAFKKKALEKDPFNLNSIMS